MGPVRKAGSEVIPVPKRGPCSRSFTLEQIPLPGYMRHHRLKLEEILQLHKELAGIKLIMTEAFFGVSRQPVAIYIKVVVFLNIICRTYIKESKRSNLISNEGVKIPRFGETIVLREEA